jgi:glucose dehydrogenase
MENRPLFVKNDLVVVHNTGGYVSGVDLKSGQLRWE